MTTKRPDYDVPSLRKAIRLMEYLCAESEPRGVTDIVRALRLNNNMVFRLLRTLEEEGWVVAADDGPRYRVSLRPFHHFSRPVRRMGLVEAARRPMESLWRATGESVYLGVEDDGRTLFLEHLDARGDIRLTASPGGRFRMHCAAPGKALLAWGDEPLVSRVIEEGLPAMTRRTLTSGRALRRDLQATRERGYALDLEEYADGLICLAAPIFDHAGRLAGTIGVSVLTLYFTPERMIGDLGPRVLATARAATETLGGRTDAAPVAGRVSNERKGKP